jgi:glutamyl-tRNA synthetase
MAITHVVRGDDHISNTPKQVLLYQAFAKPVPAFAHVPLIMGPDKKRLSKRHGATSVMEYERQGYIREGMVNFLALLGWSPGSDEELFTTRELVDRFTLEGISGGNAVFNTEKLDWFNHQHLLRLSDEELIARLQPLLTSVGLWRDELTGGERDWFARVLALLKPRAKKLPEYIDGARPFLEEPSSYDPEAVKKQLMTPGLHEHIAALGEAFATAPFEEQTLEQTLRQVADERGIKAGALIHATRIAMTGRMVSPGLFEMLVLLGRERVVARLETLVKFLGDFDRGG